MPRRISTLCGMIILCCGIAHALAIRCYEHWVDNDVSNKQVVKSSAEDLAISLDLSSLPEGVHYFNFRAQDTDMAWGALNRYLFFIPSRQSADLKLSGYEYWLDNDIANRTEKKSTENDLALSIDLSSLKEGVHYFNFRSRNNDGIYGALERYLFYIPAKENPDATLSGYDYWIDNDIASAMSVKSSNEEITIAEDISALPEGVHFFNFRPRNSDGICGAVVRYLFYVPSRANSATTFSDYDYWIDNDIASANTVTATGEEVLINEDISALPEGVHFFNFRPRNSDGICGAVVRYLFYIPSRANSDTTFSDYDYWIDNDIASANTVTATGEEVLITEDISALPEGVHFFNFRPRNSEGICGAVVRYLFYVPTKVSANPTLTHYEYWLDNDIDNRTTVKNTSEDVLLTLDIKDLSVGVHYFNYRACNSDGIWGAINSYLFYKPDGVTTETSPICGYEYRFGALTTSVDITPVMEYEINDMTIPIPALVDCCPLDANCNFTMSKDSIVMRRNVSLPFSMRFRDQIGRWSASVVESIEMSDEITHSPECLGIQKSIEFDKPTAGDFHPFYIDVAETGSYYFKASQPCTIDLYSSDGTLYRTMQEDELLKIKQIGLFEGTYYGIVHNARTDDEYPAQNITVRMLITEGYVPTPEIKYADGIATITCAQDGARIYYTLDGNDPTVESTVYTTPIEVKRNLTIKAMATYEDLSPSDICVYKVDNYKVEAPVIEFANLKLYMSCSTASSAIYYTLDGSDPLTNGVKYTGPVDVTKSCTAKAVAKRDGYNDSEITTFVFDDSAVTCVAPTIAFSNGEVTINCIQDGANVYYTVDGSEPSTSSKLYSGAFKIDENCTVKALAACEGFLNSAVTEYRIDTYKVVTPEIRFANLMVHITCGTDKSQIYYTVDGSDPSTAGTLYTSPVAISEDCIVKAMAKRSNYHDSDVAEYAVNTGSFTCPAPVFTLADNILKIECFENGSTIHYTMDGSNPTSDSQVYNSPITLIHNCVVKAYAEKQGLYDSETVTYQVDWIKAATPVFSIDGETLSISCETPGADIYFTIGGEIPDETSFKYSEPIRLENNKVVKAIAYAKNYNPSNVAECKPDIFVCGNVEIGYDGRYVTLTTKEPNAEIHYTLDGTVPGKTSPEYTGAIDAEGLVTVNAVATKEFFNDGEQAVLGVTYYYDGDKASTSECGVLAKAFGWCGTDALGSLQVEGLIDAADMTFLSSLASLRHLDIENAKTADGDIPDQAFANSSLISICMPKNVGKVGEALFDGSNHLAAIEWTATKTLPAAAITGVDNPNLLLYVKINSLAPSTITNVIASDVAESIVLSDSDGNNDFYCPRAFTAKNISYTHEYTMKTAIRGCAGWETIALPFDVQTVSHSANGEIAPFSDQIQNVKPFWLYKLAEYGFERSDRILANTPYIISMPNNDEYDDNYILAGMVTFKAKNAVVAETAVNVSTKGDFMFIPTMSKIGKDQNVYAINKNEEYNGQNAGSMFVGNLRDVSPFEGYLAIGTDGDLPAMMHLSELGIGGEEESGITIPTKDANLSVRVAERKIYIYSGIERTLSIYTMQGALVRDVELSAGVNVVDDLPQGMYIVGNIPVFLK